MKQLTEYQQNTIYTLCQSIQDGEWSNVALVQLIEQVKEFINPITLQQYADKNNISYNGAKKRNVAVELFGQKWVLDND